MPLWPRSHPRILAGRKWSVSVSSRASCWVFEGAPLRGRASTTTPYDPHRAGNPGVQGFRPPDLSRLPTERGFSSPRGTRRAAPQGGVGTIPTPEPPPRFVIGRDRRDRNDRREGGRPAFSGCRSRVSYNAPSLCLPAYPSRSSPPIGVQRPCRSPCAYPHA